MDPAHATGAVEQTFAAIGAATVARRHVRDMLRQLSPPQLADVIDMLDDVRELAKHEQQRRGTDANAA